MVCSPRALSPTHRRDFLHKPILTADYAVLQANLGFYEAFAARDMEAMDRCWSTQHRVACAHPGWQVIHGRERVMASWRAILEGTSAPDIHCQGAQTILVDQVAVVTCVERLADARLVATNVFALEEGLWKMVHHHAAPFAERSVPEASIPPPDRLN